MPKILRRHTAGYALSGALYGLGVVGMLATLFRTWSEVSVSSKPFATFWALLWNEQLDFIPSITFKLAYVFILGAVLVIAATLVLALSRQWFDLPSGDRVVFQCPFCRKQWRGRRNQEWINCPRCRKQTYPKMVAQ